MSISKFIFGDNRFADAVRKEQVARDSTHVSPEKKFQEEVQLQRRRQISHGSDDYGPKNFGEFLVALGRAMTR